VRRHLLKQFVERDRIIAHPHAGGLADRMRKRCASAPHFGVRSGKATFLNFPSTEKFKNGGFSDLTPV